MADALLVVTLLTILAVRLASNAIQEPAMLQPIPLLPQRTPPPTVDQLKIDIPV